MSNLTMKQKIILGIVIGIMLIVIGIYGYISLNKDEESLNISGMLEELEDLKILEDQEKNKDLQGNEGNQALDENASSKQNNDIVVHITGEVKETGILLLPKGARIADAVEKAGGITKNADLNQVNLAYELQDGQKIYIPNKNENIKEESKSYITSESGNNIIIESENTNKGGNKKVNINTATQSELENLPGIGGSIATRIIEYRKENGKFKNIEDLKNVKGIGDSKFNNIKEYVVAN